MSRRVQLQDATGTIIADESGNPIMSYAENAPTSGQSGFGVGAIYIDRINGNFYRNTGSLSSSTWVEADVDVNGLELVLDADGDTSITADTDDQIDIKINGFDDFQFTANTFTALSGSSIVVAGTITAQGAVVVQDGGTVTQITSITTGVTLNTNSGQITTVSSTLGAGSEATFTVTNSKVLAASTVIVNLAVTSSAGTPQAVCTAVAAGSFDVTINNLHASAALDNTMVINFVVITGSAS